MSSLDTPFPTPVAGRPKLSTVVRQALSNQKLNETVLVELMKSAPMRVTTTKQALNKWMKDNHWGRAGAVAVCQVLGISRADSTEPCGTPAEIEACYTVTFTQQRSLESRESSIATPVRKLKRPVRKNTVPQVADILRRMSRGHAMVISTQTVFPVPLNPLEPAYQLVRDASSVALDANAIIAFVIPTAAHIQAMRDIGYPGLERHDGFVRLFRSYRQGYVSHRIARGDTAAEAEAQAWRTQLLEGEHFSAVKGSEVVTLLAEVRSCAAPLRLALTRGPWSHGDVWQNPENDFEIQRLLIDTELAMRLTLGLRGSDMGLHRFCLSLAGRLNGQLELEIGH